MGRLDELGDAVRQTIRAFHGSPYDFDRFDASKIGTGEGAQSYGHGLYFAGREGVARNYRDELKGLVEMPVPDEIQNELDAAYRAAVEASRAAIQADNTDQYRSLNEAYDAAAERMYEAQHKYREAAYNPGRMYEVEIGHPEEALLDWDRSMGESVAARLTPKLRGGLERGIRDRLDMGQLGRHADNLRAMRDNPALAPGQVLHEGLSADYGSAAAADGLLDAGIPGIRYLDQGSRRAGEGTRNYVMFPGTEDSIRILRKYAVPGAVGAGAASMGGDGDQ